MNDDDDKWTFEEIYAVVQLVLMLLKLDATQAALLNFCDESSFAYDEMIKALRRERDAANSTADNYKRLCAARSEGIDELERENADLKAKLKAAEADLESEKRKADIAAEWTRGFADKLKAAEEREVRLLKLLRDINFYYGGDTHSGVAKRISAALAAADEAKATAGKGETA